MPQRGLSVMVGKSQMGRPQKPGCEVINEKEKGGDNIGAFFEKFSISQQKENRI